MVILEVVRAQPDATFVELLVVLKKRGIRTSRSSLWRFFGRHDITFKKKSLFASERQRWDPKKPRLEGRGSMLRPIRSAGLPTERTFSPYIISGRLKGRPSVDFRERVSERRGFRRGTSSARDRDCAGNIQSAERPARCGGSRTR